MCNEGYSRKFSLREQFLLSWRQAFSLGLKKENCPMTEAKWKAVLLFSGREILEYIQS